MAVVGTAQEMPGSPTATIELGQRKYRREFLVKCSSMDDGPLVAYSALTALGIDLYSSYSAGNEYDTEALLRSITPERVRPGFAAWKLVLEYSTPPQKDDGGAGGGPSGTGGGTGRQTPGEFTNPLLELPAVKISNTSREVLLTQIFDINSGVLKPCTASNGQVFDPPPKVLERCMELTITRNEPLTANHPIIGMMFANAVNSDTFWGLPAGVWKVKHINPERQQKQLPNGSTFAYLRVEYSFEGKPLKVVNLANLSLPPSNEIVSSWDIQLLDYGDHYRIAPPAGVNSPGELGFRNPQNGRDPTRVDFQTRGGTPTTGLLDGKGGALPDQVTFTVNSGTDVFTVPVGSYVFTEGLQVTVTNVGGALPAPLTAMGAYYIKYVSDTTFKLSLTQGGAAIDITDVGTGTHFIGSQGVFMQIRPYNRLPYTLLGLPNSFLQVQ